MIPTFGKALVATVSTAVALVLSGPLSAHAEAAPSVGTVVSASAPTATVPDVSAATADPHLPIHYVSAPGDDIPAIANWFNLTVDQIKYSNPGIDQVSPGTQLVLPPVPGIVYTVQAGDTVQGIAWRYQVDPNDLASFNKVIDPNWISPGDTYVIPNAQLPPRVWSPPPTVARTSTVAVVTTIAPSSPISGALGNHFAFGYCTWYVANRVHDVYGFWIPWLGDAWSWYGNARAAGFATGSMPRLGSIMVTWESGFGHVAYVTSVLPNGGWTVDEMNYRGWDIVSSRTINPGTVPLIGFIYP